MWVNDMSGGAASSWMRDFGWRGGESGRILDGMVAPSRLLGVRAWMLIAMGCVLPMAAAQQGDPATGSVTGQVICGDTQLPARFASVTLVEVPSGPALTSKPNGSAGQDKTATDASGNGKRFLAVTGLDGSYTATHVVPGDYYAVPMMAGYAEPVSMVRAAMEAGVDLTKPIPGIPIVHVSAGVTSRQDLMLVRGGAVSGRVLWDDGSPVPDAVVKVRPAREDAKKLPSQFGALDWGLDDDGEMFSRTNDLGQYRIAGLAPGKYVAVAVVIGPVQTETHAGKTTMTESDLKLTAYAPESFRRRGAKPIEVSAGREQVGEDITFNLTGTHSVSGRMVSAEDGQGISSGNVQLNDASDTALTRAARVDSNGNFTVRSVPSGSYQLTVTGAADAGRSFAGGDQSVVVSDSDVVGVSIALQPSTNAQGKDSP